MTGNILVIADLNGPNLKNITKETLTLGRQLADQAHGKIDLLLMGSDLKKAAKESSLYGPDTIFICENQSYSDYRPDIYKKVAQTFINSNHYTLILTGNTYQGKDLSIRLAASFGAPLSMDNTDITFSDGHVLVKKQSFGSKILSNFKLKGNRVFLTLKPNFVQPVTSDHISELSLQNIDSSESRYTFIEKKISSEKTDLTESRVIISGGYGVGSEDFSKLETLADLMNGAVGASRSAVDSGWRPVSDQIGQTGKVVSPELYIACGISGAIQHFAGMMSSQVIVAVNKNPDAPIFQKCDYGVVGDLHEILPLLTDRIKELKQ